MNGFIFSVEYSDRILRIPYYGVNALNFAIKSFIFKSISSSKLEKKYCLEIEELLFSNETDAAIKMWNSFQGDESGFTISIEKIST